MTDLPEGWKLARLDELCEWIGGGTPRRSEPSFFGGSYPWITISDLTDSTVTKTSEYLTDAGIANSAAKLVPPNAVLVALYGSIGKLGITGQASTTNQAIASALPDDSAYDPRFLFHFLRSIRHDLAKLGTGVTQKNIYLADLKAVSIPVAPRAEQSRIVSAIDELLSDLDAGVSELEAAQKKLGQCRQSLLKAAVEGALTSDWRTKHTPAETGAQLLERILTERRARWEAKQLVKFKEQGKAPPKGWQNKYPEPAGPDTPGLSSIPTGWAWATVEQLGHVQLGRQRSPDKVGKANPTPYIRAANITESGIDLSNVLEMEFSEAEKETFALRVGDVLLTEASGSPEHVGRPAIWEKSDGLYCFQNTVLRFVPVCIGSKYAFYSFLAMQKLGVFSSLSGGVGINHLSAGKFSRLPVPVPPLAEQEELVQILEDALARCDEQQFANSLALKQATAQRQNILRAAFAGQLVPQDPDDEPASVLLERVQASRAERGKQPRARKNKQLKEMADVARKLIDVLAEAGDWVPAQEAFRRCGVADGAGTDEVEALYAELRRLDKGGRLAVEAVTDANGRKLHDRLKLLAG